MTVLCEQEVARRAASLENHGFRRAGIDVLEAALTADPHAGALWRLRARMLDRDGRFDEAFANMQQALALVPLGPEEMLVIAEGYERAGLKASAVDVLTSLADCEALPTDLWLRIFAALVRVEQRQAALELARRAARKRPDDDVAYYAMAQALICLRRPPEMIVGVLVKAVDLNPADARYRTLLALQLVRLGKNAEAYGCVAELAAECYAEVSCACCIWKLLRLCVAHGDAPRAAVFGAQLAHLTAAAKARGAAKEETA